jgi:general secretion pathway protein D
MQIGETMKYNVRWLGWMMVTGLLMLCPNRAAADSVGLSISSPLTVTQGDSFAAAVNISGVTDLYGFQLDMNFDPTVLQLTDVMEGTFLPSGGNTFFIPGTIDNVAGSAAFNADSLLTAISGVNGGGTLLQFDFTGTGVGTSFLNLGNVLLLDSSGNEIASSLTGGSVSVVSKGGTIPTPEPGVFSLLLSVFGVFGLITACRKKTMRAI